MARRESYDSCLSALLVLHRGLEEEDDNIADGRLRRTTDQVRGLDGTLEYTRWHMYISVPVLPVCWHRVHLPSSRPGIAPIAVCSVSGSHRAYS